MLVRIVSAFIIHPSQAPLSFTAGIDGVLMNLYHDIDKDGVLDLAEQTPELSTSTGDNPDTPEVETGWYDFDVTADVRTWLD